MPNSRAGIAPRLVPKYEPGMESRWEAQQAGRRLRGRHTSPFTRESSAITNCKIMSYDQSRAGFRLSADPAASATKSPPRIQRVTSSRVTRSRHRWTPSHLGRIASFPTRVDRGVGTPDRAIRCGASVGEYRLCALLLTRGSEPRPACASRRRSRAATDGSRGVEAWWVVNDPG